MTARRKRKGKAAEERAEEDESSKAGPDPESERELDAHDADGEAIELAPPADAADSSLPVVESIPADDKPERGVTRRDPLTVYVQEIRKIPLLSREDEHDLAVSYRDSGDLELAKKLVAANLRLVVKIAHEYRRAYRNLLDLVQEGNVGLIQAVKKYDPDRGVKLSSYAAWWIRAYILKFILNNWRLVKIGTTQAQRKLFFNLRKEKEKLEALGFTPDHRLLSERLQVSESDVAEMEQRLDSADLSLDVPISRDDEGGRTRLDAIPATDSRPDTRVENEQFRAVLRQKLETFAASLKGRDETLFRKRWLTDAPQTLQEIGNEFGISRERARQLERRMLDRLRVYLEAELGTAVDIGALGAEE